MQWPCLVTEDQWTKLTLTWDWLTWSTIKVVRTDWGGKEEREVKERKTKEDMAASQLADNVGSFFNINSHSTTATKS